MEMINTLDNTLRWIKSNLKMSETEFVDLMLKRFNMTEDLIIELGYGEIYRNYMAKKLTLDRKEKIENLIRTFRGVSIKDFVGALILNEHITFLHDLIDFNEHDLETLDKIVGLFMDSEYNLLHPFITHHMRLLSGEQDIEEDLDLPF